MKILGERSLTSKVRSDLIILFIIISIIDIFVMGIIALFIIYNFIKIFENLKYNELFSENNSKRLNIIGNNCFALGIFYFIIVLFTILTADSYLTKNLINYIIIFSMTLMIIFIVSGVGIKVLNEIYKKAIEFKEENDFTI